MLGSDQPARGIRPCARISDVSHHTFEQAAEEAAAEERRGKAAPIRAWLRDTCEINNNKELTAILDLCVDPKFWVNNLKVLFALEETDFDTLLRQAGISVGALGLIKQAWRKERSSS